MEIMQRKYAYLWAAVTVLLAFIVWPSLSGYLLHITQIPEQEVTPPQPAPQPAPEAQTAANRLFRAYSVPNIAGELRFSGEIPATWLAEYIPEIEALNLYDPAAAGDTPLQQSQVFIRHFTANTFLTLQTVDILEREDVTLNGRPAVTYRINKRIGVDDFPFQPQWRSREHTVTDVRVSDRSPSVFYVIAKRPDLTEGIYTHFLDTLRVVAPLELTLPIDEFYERATLKPFGVYITPKTSPVPNDRFSGYHTGVDIEFTDTDEKIPVYAIAEGEVVRAQYASGYGGVVIIRHRIDGSDQLALYGHLDPDSLPVVGDVFMVGEIIGHLGEGYSDETDGVRKHLHFALIRSDRPLLFGYVTFEDELTGWIDPVTWFQERL